MLHRNKNTRSIIVTSFGIAILSLSTSLLAATMSMTDSIDKALSEGDISLTLRYRYEY